MGSPITALSPVTTNTIMTMEAIEPIVDLLKDAYVQEKVEEAAKLFYTNDTVNVNLYWAAAAALLFFLLLIPLLALLFQPSGSSGGGYGAPSTGYGAPEESYGAPAASYGSPGHSYSRSDDIYGEARSLNNILSSADVDGTLELNNFAAIKPLMAMAGNAAAKLLE